MKEKAVIHVRGLVQGVGFRYYVQRVASGLGLKGYAENLDNGDVKIVAEGDHGLLEELLKTIKIGPRSAHVTSLKVEWEKASHDFTGFEIR